MQTIHVAPRRAQLSNSPLKTALRFAHQASELSALNRIGRAGFPVTERTMTEAQTGSANLVSVTAAIGSPVYGGTIVGATTVNVADYAAAGLPGIPRNIASGASAINLTVFDVYGQAAGNIIAAWTTVTVCGIPRMGAAGLAGARAFRELRR